MSLVLQSRTGRDKQRYEKNFRLVAGVVPYRMKLEKEKNCRNFEVLMVSSPNRKDFIFPKGGWENDETVVEAARREALEEAGVKGNLDENPLGDWIFRSKSSESNCTTSIGGGKGQIFALEVKEELEYWPEQDTHARIWVNAGDAYEVCRYDWMREALDALKNRLFMANYDRPAVTTSLAIYKVIPTPTAQLIRMLSSKIMLPCNSIKCFNY